MLRCNVSWCVMLCCSMSRWLMSWYVVLHCFMSCCVMLCAIGADFLYVFRNSSRLHGKKRWFFYIFSDGKTILRYFAKYFWAETLFPECWCISRQNGIVLSWELLRYAMLWSVILCCNMSRCMMSWYVVLHCDMLCCVMLWAIGADFLYVFRKSSRLHLEF